MKKILFILSTLERSGPVNVVYNLVKTIDKSIFIIYILTLSPESKRSCLLNFLEITNLEIYSLKYSRIIGLLFGFNKTEKIIDKIKPDIIHSHGIRADKILSKLKTSAIKIATVHSFLDKDYIMTYGKFIGKIMCKTDISCLRKMNICIGVSKSLADQLKNKFYIKNTIGIPNGIDTKKYFTINDNEKKELRKKLSFNEDDTVFITTGHLSVGKDPLFLIKQWIIYKKEILSKIHLYFLGDGELYNECIKNAIINENIHIIGKKENVDEYLKASDYYVSASRSEGISLSVLEAMACGLPLLLTDIPPFKEILSHGNNLGINYKLDNTKDFIEKLQILLKKDKKEIKKEAALTANQIFSIEKMVEQYKNVYMQYDNIYK